MVLAADADLRVGTHYPLASGHRYTRVFEFNKPVNGFPSKPWCDVTLSADDPVLPAGIEFRVTKNFSHAGPQQGKLGIEYKMSTVVVHSTHERPSVLAIVYCMPEDVPKFNLVGSDSSGRMMKTPEVQMLVQTLLQFPDAR